MFSFHNLHQIRSNYKQKNIRFNNIIGRVDNNYPVPKKTIQHSQHVKNSPKPKPKPKPVLLTQQQLNSPIIKKIVNPQPKTNAPSRFSIKRTLRKGGGFNMNIGAKKGTGVRCG